MAGRIGSVMPLYLFSGLNPNISTDLAEYDEAEYNPAAYLYNDNGGGVKRGAYYRISGANNLGIVGKIQRSFFDDFYYRIYVDPQQIDLQTIASAQTRQVKVWNAFPNLAANLVEINISNPAGISISGQEPPYSMAPLQELEYEITVDTNGPPDINVQILFDFSNVPDPLPLLITGTRAIKFDIIPEVPVTEIWEWVTDIDQATDSSEQRMSVSGDMPRIKKSFKVIFASEAECRDFYVKLLTAKGRLFVSEYEYATRTTQKVLAGSNVIVYDNADTDIRPGEYVLILTDENSALVQVDSLTPTGCLLQANLAFDLPIGSLIAPGSPSLLDNQTSLDRYPVNAGETNISVTFLRQRETLVRNGNAVVLPTFLGLPVCDKRALAESLIADAVSTGQTLIDNGFGLPNIVTHWAYPRVGGPREFKVNRKRKPEEMDYWKVLLKHASGKAKKFWLNTFRPDLILNAVPGDAANSLSFVGDAYAINIYPIQTHRFIEIETASGIHRTRITGATVVDGASVVAISPALPAGAGWQQFLRVSYLLPIRLDEDSVEWKHRGLESFLSLSIITAEYP